MEKNGIAEKYRASSYKSLKGKISLLSEILDNAYGKSYCQISNPTLIGNTVDLGISDANKGKSRAITHSFGIKLRALMLGKEAEITFCDAQGTKKKYKFTDEERLSFVLFGILYASRYTKELWIDRRENSKSLAWSSVLLALGNIKEVGAVVDRPKALGDIRGVTYIYGVFYRFGLIDVPDKVKEKMNKCGCVAKS